MEIDSDFTQPSFAATETSRFSHKHQQKELLGKSTYERYTETRITASTIEADGVEALFNPEFVNCPDKSDIGNKIDGSSVEDVTGNIIGQLQPAGFMPNSIELFNKYYLDKYPNYHQSKIEDLVQAHNIIFKDIEIDGKDAGEQMDNFNKALINIESNYSSFNAQKIRIYYERLLNAFIRENNEGQNDQSSLHRELIDFWNNVFIYMDTTELRKESNEKVTTMTFRGYGFAQAAFDMHVSNEFVRGLPVRKEVLKENKTIPGAQGDATLTGEKRDLGAKPNVLKLFAMPDMTGYTEVIGSKRLKKPRLFLVAELKAIHVVKAKSGTSDAQISCDGMMSPPKDSSYDGMKPSASKGKHKESGSSSDSRRHSSRMSSPPTKKFKHASDSTEVTNITNAIRTQHFLELLCAIKKENLIMNSPLQKCYGLFIVKHRVYITCLCAIDKMSCDNLRITNIRLANFMSIANTPELFKNGDFRLRMVSTDYLDMTNAIHMKAILKFIVVLGMQEGGDT